jgi:photosystem II stability/assembly factor-like uncharacterized protein
MMRGRRPRRATRALTDGAASERRQPSTLSFCRLTPRPAHAGGRAGTLPLSKLRAATCAAVLAAALAAVWPSPASAAPSQGPAWRWQLPLPQGNGVHGLAFPTRGDGWFVGDAGTIMRTADGGATWSRQRSGTTSALHGVAFVDANTGYTVGAAGTVLRTANGGSAWARRTSHTTLDLTGVAFVDRRRGLVVGEQGLILSTANGGLTWQRRRFRTGAATLNAVARWGTRWAWAAGDQNTILRTGNGGLTWRRLKTGLGIDYDVADVAFISRSEGWALANYVNDESMAGVLLHTTNGGSSWRVQGWQPDVAVAAFLSLAFDSTGRFGVIVGDRDDEPDGVTDGPVVLSTTDGGRSWLHASSGSLEPATAVVVTPRGTTWVAEASGTLSWSDDKCTTWSRSGHSIGAGVELNGIDFVDRSLGWAVGSNGSIARTVDGGASWDAQPSGLQAALRAVSFADAQHGLAVGDHVVMATSDGGSHWAPVQTDTDAVWTGVVFGDLLHAWIVGERWNQSAQRYDALMLRTVDGGATWAEQAQAGTSTGGLRSLSFASDRLGWAVGVGGLVWRTADGGQSWTRLKWNGRAGLDLLGVAFVDERTGWAVGEQLSIYRTTDGGATWKLQRAARDGGNEWFEALQAVVFTDAKTGWAVGGHGRVFHTRDGGATWLRQAAGTDVWLNAADFVDANNGWIAGFHGSILATSCGGDALGRRATSQSGSGAR